MARSPAGSRSVQSGHRTFLVLHFLESARSNRAASDVVPSLKIAPEGSTVFAAGRPCRFYSAACKCGPGPRAPRAAASGRTRRWRDRRWWRTRSVTGVVAQHPFRRQASAVQLKRKYPSVRQPDIDRRGIARSHHLRASRDEGAQLFLRQFIGAGIAAVMTSAQ